LTSALYDTDTNCIYAGYANPALNIREIWKYDISSNSHSTYEISNFPEHECRAITLDKVNNRIIMADVHDQRLYSVSTTGGILTQIGNGINGWQMFEKNSFHNPYTNNPVIMNGYGYYSLKNYVLEYDLSSSTWITRFVDSSNHPWRRASASITTSADKSKVFMFGGLAKQSGSQYGNPDPGYLPWANGLGYWNWQRDLWQLDLDTWQWTSLVGPNSNSILAEGAISYNDNTNEIILIGQFSPITVWGDYPTYVGGVYKYEIGVDTGFVPIQELDEIPPIPTGYGDAYLLRDNSIYDSVNDRVLYFRYDGIWSLTLYETYTVYVYSSPTGAEIFVDGISTGLYTDQMGTPIDLLLPGPHEITLGPVGLGYDGAYVCFPDTLLAITDGQVLIFETFPEIWFKFFIQSNPIGALITINGVDYGMTSSDGVYVELFEGDYTISLGPVTVEGITYSFTPQYISVYYGDDDPWLPIIPLYFQGIISGVLEPGNPTQMVPPPNVLISSVTFETPGSTTFNIDYQVVNINALTHVPPNHGLNNDNSYAVVLNASEGTADLHVTVPAGIWWICGYWEGSWHQATPYPYQGSVPGTVILSGIPFNSKGEVPIVVANIDPTLPVELSSFSATVTSDCFVSLNWVTQTESNVAGYNVYRSDNNSAPEYRVNMNIIPATNTSSQHTYSFVDTENLQMNSTYFYWLENVDMNGMSDMYGPVSVTLTNPEIPTPTEVSVMKNAYPNPFYAGSSTNIEVYVKDYETGTVTIYNLKGQVVASFKNLTGGTHTLTWNSKGCSSGIYFYKLSTPSTIVTKKMVLVN